jgi:hypothetical protein
MAIRTDFTAGEVLAAADLNDTFASKLNLAGGKILQIVRATDSTNRSTSSASFVDVTGMSVTITPQKSDSAVLLIASFIQTNEGTNTNIIATTVITDSSNNLISGTGDASIGVGDATNISYRVALFAYATPATTSAVTYKLRHKLVFGTATTINNGNSIGQMYAIEVSA